MSTFQERLQTFIRHIGSTPYQVNKVAGLSQGLLIKVISNNHHLTVGNIQKILLAYPELNADWLITGRGDMLCQQQAPPVEPEFPPLPADLEHSLYRIIIWHLLLQDNYAATKQQLQHILHKIETIHENTQNLHTQLLQLQQVLEAQYAIQPQDHGLYEMTLRIAAGENGKYIPAHLKEHIELDKRLAEYLNLLGNRQL